MKPVEKKLIRLFNSLASPERDMLMGFAEYLVTRAKQQASAVKETLPKPLEIPRPESESVVAAIKRLSRSYHMLDDARLLNETSVLMSQHVMQGREAEHVIDELEQLFERFYEELQAEYDSVLEDSAGC